MCVCVCVCVCVHMFECINVLKDSLCTAGCAFSGVGPSTLGVYYGVEGTHWICTVSTVQ